MSNIVLMYANGEDTSVTICTSQSTGNYLVCCYIWSVEHRLIDVFCAMFNVCKVTGENHMQVEPIYT